MNFPSELLYTKDHEWIRIEGDTATVGVTDFAQSELGDIVFVDIPSEGDSLASEAVFGSVEAVKTVSDLYLPLAGEILEVNAELDAAPEKVNSDPYGSGWMVKVRLNDASDRTGLMDAEAYKALVGA